MTKQTVDMSSSGGPLTVVLVGYPFNLPAESPIGSEDDVEQTAYKRRTAADAAALVARVCGKRSATGAPGLSDKAPNVDTPIHPAITVAE